MNNAKIKYTLTKSELTPIVGQYIARIIANRTIGISKLSAEMRDGRSVVEDADVKLVISALAEEIATELVVNHNRVDFLGLLTFELAVNGSLPAMDSSLGEGNAIYIAVHPSDSLRAEAAKIIPVRESAALTQVKIDNVEDLATHQKAFVTTNEAVITGRNLSATGDGESLVLKNPDGTVAAQVTILEKDGCGERLYCKLATAVPTGPYILELTTHGYSTPGGESNAYTKSVTAIGA